jgi:GTPase
VIPDDPDALLEAARGGSRGALARALTLIESGGEPQRALARSAYAAPAPYALGVTGPPGAGKSTLTDRVVAALLDGIAERVAVLCVDPSSPFTGGAILGDRIRMQDHATDPRVYIRSMATRGHLGGLALAVPDAVRVLGALGWGWVIVETVGVGQLEVDVAATADTTVVVTNPGWGDSTQAAKAGLLEVADVFVINKADRDGVAETRRDLEQMLDLSAPGAWRAPVVATVATTGEGVDGLLGAILDHRDHLRATPSAQRGLERARAELERALGATLRSRVAGLDGGAAYDEQVAALAEGRTDPYRAAEALLGPA